jgi:hypothetical protein
MPLSMIENSPFDSYLVPGIILFGVLGLVPCFVLFALLKKPGFKLAESINFSKDMHWSWTFSIYIVFALIIWTQLQMVFLNTINWLHTFYMFYALAMLFVALLPMVRKSYKKS